MPIDVERIVNVSSKDNNCGFYCIGHCVAKMLLHSEKKLPKCFNTQVYQDLLAEFKRHYQCKELTWQHIKKLLQIYDSPYDHELILGPMLRAYLTSVLFVNQSQISADFFPVFSSVVSKKNDEKELDYDEMNFQDVAACYLRSPNNSMELDEFWNNTGYMTYITSLIKSRDMSSEELIVLTKKLQIALEIYVDDIGQPSLGFTPRKNYGTLRVILQNRHWLFEIVSTEAKAEYDEKRNYSYLPHDDELNPIRVSEDVYEVLTAIIAKRQITKKQRLDVSSKEKEDKEISKLEKELLDKCASCMHEGIQGLAQRKNLKALRELQASLHQNDDPGQNNEKQLDNLLEIQRDILRTINALCEQDVALIEVLTGYQERVMAIDFGQHKSSKQQLLDISDELKKMQKEQATQSNLSMRQR